MSQYGASPLEHRRLTTHMPSPSPNRSRGSQLGASSMGIPLHSTGQINQQLQDPRVPIRPWQDPRVFEEMGGWINTRLDPASYPPALELPSYGSESTPSPSDARSQNHVVYHAHSAPFGRPQQHQQRHEPDVANVAHLNEGRLAHRHAHTAELVDAGHSSRNGVRSTQRSRDRRNRRRDQQIESHGRPRGYSRRNCEEQFYD